MAAVFVSLLHKRRSGKVRLAESSINQAQVVSSSVICHKELPMTTWFEFISLFGFFPSYCPLHILVKLTLYFHWPYCADLLFIYFRLKFVRRALTAVGDVQLFIKLKMPVLSAQRSPSQSFSCGYLHTCRMMCVLRQEWQ